MIFYKFITNLILHRKYNKLIQQIYDNEDLINKFSKLFGTEFDKDWVGRLYTVINPNINNEKLDINTQIFEYSENGFSNDLYVERWIMMKFNLIKDFIIANNLFDILTYNIKRLDEYDNYLFVIEPVTFHDFMKWTKIFSITYTLIAIISTVLLVVL